MSEITYNMVVPTLLKVFIGRKRVGTISKTSQGWQYRPFASSALGGEYFKTLAECKRSIEGGSP